MTTGSPAAAGALVFAARADVNRLGRLLYGNCSCVRGLATLGRFSVRVRLQGSSMVFCFLTVGLSFAGNYSLNFCEKAKVLKKCTDFLYFGKKSVHAVGGLCKYYKISENSGRIKAHFTRLSDCFRSKSSPTIP